MTDFIRNELLNKHVIVLISHGNLLEVTAPQRYSGTVIEVNNLFLVLLNNNNKILYINNKFVVTVTILD